MTRRHLSMLLLGGTLSLAGATPLLVGAAPADTDDARAAITEDERRPVVQWVFDDASLFECRSPAFTLRHLRQQYGNTVKVVAVGVGVDEESARAFLHAQRLDVPFVSLSAAAYRERYAASPVPGLFVLAGKRFVGSYPAAGLSRKYPEPEQLRASVQASLALLPSFAVSTFTPRRTS